MNKYTSLIITGEFNSEDRETIAKLLSEITSVTEPFTYINHPNPTFQCHTDLFIGQITNLDFDEFLATMVLIEKSIEQSALTDMQVMVRNHTDVLWHTYLPEELNRDAFDSWQDKQG